MTTAREDELQEEIRQLKAFLGCSPDKMRLAMVRAYFGLSRVQGRVLLMLFDNPWQCLPNERLALAFDDRNAEHDHAIAHLIMRLRNAIGRDGIRNVSGEGYAITPAGVARVKRVLDRWEAAT